MKTWVISDTHFYHARMIDACQRPDDFTAKIVLNWSRLVSPEDIVYHLGDVVFYEKEKFAGLIGGLPGTKILIRGNHDKLPMKWYLDHGFISVMDYALVNVVYTKGIKRPRNIYSQVLLSHAPMAIAESTFFRGHPVNVHGHFHNNPATHWERELVEVLTPDHYLFSLEEMNYGPLELAPALMHGRLISSYERAKDVL